jgi:hypothetical protein
MKIDLLAAKVRSAKTALAEAETNLERAIGEIRSAPRAEKVAIGDVLETAFERLRRAKTDLAEIEERLTAEQDA